MLDPIATVEDFALRISGGVPESEEERAFALLQDASALIRAIAGTDWEESGDEEPPDVAVMICMAAAKRAYINSDGIRSESIDGEYATSYFSPDVYLTAAEETRIHQAMGTSGLWALSTTRGGPDTSRVRGYVGVVVAQEEIDPFDI